MIPALSKYPRYSNFIIFAILLLIPVLIASPLLYRFLPLSDGPAHFFKVWLLRYELDNYGELFDWNPFWYGGQPLFRFYPPMSYWITVALSYIIPIQLYKIFNLIIFLSYITLSFSTYYLCRTLKFSKISSTVASVLVVISPTLASFYSSAGTFPTIIAFAFVPLVLALLIKSFDEKKLRYVILTALTFSFIFLLHHLTTYFTIMLFALIFIVKAFPFSYDNLKRTFKYALIILGISFLITSFWTIPLILELQYSNLLISLNLAVDPFQILFTTLTKGCIEFYCLNGVGPEFTILGLIGIFLSFIYINFKNRDVHFKFDFKKNYILVSLMFLVTLLILFLSYFVSLKIIPFGENLNYARFGLYLILPMSLLGGIIIDRFRKDFTLLVILLTILAIIFSNYAFISFARNYNFLYDASTISYSERVRNMYDFIKNTDDGRMEIYGTFRPFASSIIPILTQKQVITGWYHQGDLTYDTILNKIEEPYLGDAGFLDRISEDEYFEILDEGFVKYILINVCSPEGSKVNETLVKRFDVIYEHDACFKILGNNKTYFTNPNLEWKRISPEEILIYNVPEGILLVKESYYPHWHSYCNDREFSIQPDEYGMIVIDAESCKELYLKYEYPIFYKSFYFVSLIALPIVIIGIFIKNRIKSY